MKTIIYLLICILMPVFSFSNNEKLLNSSVKNVTVFLSSAQVNRAANFTVDAGITDLIFDGISPFINPKSIQVKGNGKITILDVKYIVKQPEIKLKNDVIIPVKIINDIKLVQDSLNNLSFDIDDIVNKKEVLMLEKKVLLQNKFMQGNVDTIPELKDAMTYLRKQLNDINQELNRLKRDEFKFKNIQSDMQERLDNLKAYNNQQNPEKQEDPKHQIIITVSSETAEQGKLNISYMVGNAGWNPEYDIRAEGINKPITLVYKANVYQNAGEDWKSVNLKLSTIVPNQGYTKPTLNVQYLNYLYYNIAVALSRKGLMKENDCVGGALSSMDESFEYDKNNTFQPIILQILLKLNKQ